MHAPLSFDLHKLFEKSLQERAALEKEGPLEDDVEIEEHSVSSSSPLPFTPRSSCASSPPPPPLQDLEDILPHFLSNPPPSYIFSEPIERPVAVPQSACSAAPGLQVSRGAVCFDGLTRDEFHRLKKREKGRGKRRDERAKKQAQVGDALKAATRRHRASCLALPVDFTMQPQYVHIARTGVLGKAMKAATWHKKKMGFSAAKKLGFNVVKWSAQYVPFVGP